MTSGTPKRQQPSLRTVARRAGVSIATVSRVINGLDARISAETIKRVRTVIDEVGYRPQQSGRALRRKQSSIIGALSVDLANAYYAAIAQSIEAAGRGRDYAMLLADTGGDAKRQDESLLEMQSYNVRGIVMFGSVATPTLKRMISDRVPIVFIIRPSSVPLPAPLIGVDNLRAGQDVADHFHANELSPAGALLGTLGSQASDARVQGFTRRMQCYGHEVIVSSERGVIFPLMESGYLQTSALLARHPGLRAIFCATDTLAYGAYRRCYELGLRVPEDIVLFGFDDNPLNQWVAPWLSTVRTPYEQFGTTVWSVFEKLWEGTEAAPQVVLPHELIIRPDKGPPPLTSQNSET